MNAVGGGRNLMPEQTFLETWQFLQKEAAERNLRLQSRYESAVAELSAALHGQTSAVQEQVMPASIPGAVESFGSFLEGPGERVLFEPIRGFRKLRPQQKALDALEEHEEALDDLVRRLPQTVDVSGLELADALGPYIPSRIHAYFLRKRDRMGFPLRRIVELQFLAEAEHRAQLDGALFLLLAQSTLLLVAPWQDLRQYVLRSLAGQEVDQRAWDQSRTRWLRSVNAVKEQAEVRLAALKMWTGSAVDRLALAILGGRRADGRRQDPKLLLRRQTNFRYWSRQQRAVTAVLDLEWELTEMLGEVAGTAADALASIDTEQAALLRELDSVVAWLRESQEGNMQGGFPPPEARLVSAEDRVSVWGRAVETTARGHLPLLVETVEPQSDLPRRREPWTRLEPNKHFLAAVTRAGRPMALAGFQEVENSHTAIVRVIERAREVVRFSLDTVQAEPEEAAAVKGEGLANALALVSYQRDSAIDPHPIAERKLVLGIAGSFLLAHLVIEQRRLGLLTHLARESGSRAAREIWKVVLGRIATTGRWVRDHILGLYHWLLLKIGWEAPPIAIQAPIVTRGYLGEVLSLQHRARDLPMIYRRLFRLAPVEEPRFLVGRESEMTALARARDLWLENRSVSVVVVGDRGTGKTSILNCAIATEFPDVQVVRSQFSERITDAGQMRRFLHEVVGIPEDQDLMEGLLAQKRIIMLEEVERTFIRRMNGFGGLEELLSIVSGSSRTNLWVLSLNRHSFRYLDAAVGLGQYFSHRINAMAIPPSQLKKAILLRHNLSGLRLQYPAVPESDTRLSALRKLLGLEPNPEDSFFDALYRQSEGIFRSAFELWQSFMERVEGGVLYLQRPAEPNYEPLIAQFTLQDSFTLQAVFQHGSLTDWEHSEIFECPVQQSQVALEKLLNLECLELDPSGPGLRVRPEAGRMVRMALQRQNLI